MKPANSSIDDDIGDIIPIHMATRAEAIDKAVIAPQVAAPENGSSQHFERLSARIARQCHQVQDSVKETLRPKVWIEKDPIHFLKGWLNTASGKDRETSTNIKVKNACLEKSGNQTQECTRGRCQLGAES